MARSLEAILARHRALSIAALAALTLLAWGWLVAGAGMGMEPLISALPPTFHASHHTMPSSMAMGQMAQTASPWTAWRLILTVSMWWTMMVAMMLPSAAPTILLYARTAAHGQPSARPATPSFLAGYLATWSVFALLASALQQALERTGFISTEDMASENRTLCAAVLIAAGAYQLSPLKNLCLRHCRNPAQFLSRHYRPGRGGALRMGVIHGAYCLGCCWLLMALLFVGGVMNLAWIALLTLMVAAEKLLPFGRFVATASGLACIAAGAYLLLA